MTTDLHTPITPTPEWTAAVRSRCWGTPERNPYLISINAIADAIGIQRESMSSNASARPDWFPFEPVTIGRSENGGQPLRYYRRSDVEPWINQYIACSAREGIASAPNGPEWYPETCKPRTDNLTAAERHEATMRELWYLRTGQEVA